MPDEDRLRLRHTFNAAAGSYHRVRPDYPAELFDELIAVAGLAPGDHLLEVGCGPGKATVPLARRGFRITCIEENIIGKWKSFHYNMLPGYRLRWIN